jgi:transposase
MYYK